MKSKQFEQKKLSEGLTALGLDSGCSIVYVTVSSGQEIMFVDVPNLVGISEDAAKAKLEAARLYYGGAERVPSEFEAGTVIGQIPEAFSQIEEHSKITLVISSGPSE